MAGARDAAGGDRGLGRRQPRRPPPSRATSSPASEAREGDPEGCWSGELDGSHRLDPLPLRGSAAPAGDDTRGSYSRAAIPPCQVRVAGAAAPDGWALVGPGPHLALRATLPCRGGIGSGSPSSWEGRRCVSPSPPLRGRRGMRSLPWCGLRGSVRARNDDAPEGRRPPLQTPTITVEPSTRTGQVRRSRQARPPVALPVLISNSA